MGKTMDFLQKLYDEAAVAEIEFSGKCHDCGADLSILTKVAEDGTLTLEGGALWYNDKVYAKCEACFEADPVLRNYQSCEVYSRVVGYMRPVNQWNCGKKAEWDNRVPYKVEN